jgi:hypothetical protein
MAFAFEEIANAAGHGHVEATTAPALPHHGGRDHDKDKDKDKDRDQD